MGRGSHGQLLPQVQCQWRRSQLRHACALRHRPAICRSLYAFPHLSWERSRNETFSCAHRDGLGLLPHDLGIACTRRRFSCDRRRIDRRRLGHRCWRFNTHHRPRLLLPGCRLHAVPLGTGPDGAEPVSRLLQLLRRNVGDQAEMRSQSGGLEYLLPRPVSARARMPVHSIVRRRHGDFLRCGPMHLYLPNDHRCGVRGCFCLPR